MRTIKQNWLAVGVLLSMLFSYAASASIITRPYGASDYAGGTRAVGTKVNAEFANITNWLNGGNISSQNIASSGVYTDNIRDAAVTPAKMASRNIASANISLASTSATSATVASGTATMTGATGRPVMIGLIGSNVGGSINVFSATQTAYFATIQIWRDSTLISSQDVGGRVQTAGNLFQISVPFSSIQHIDVAAVTGTKGYFIKVLVSNAAVTLEMTTSAQIYAIEL